MYLAADYATGNRALTSWERLIRYARMMQLRTSLWMGAQIIRLRGGRRDGSGRHPVKDAPMPRSAFPL
jgi:hypothetical protein